MSPHGLRTVPRRRHPRPTLPPPRGSERLTCAPRFTRTRTGRRRRRAVVVVRVPYGRHVHGRRPDDMRPTCLVSLLNQRRPAVSIHKYVQ